MENSRRKFEENKKIDITTIVILIIILVACIFTLIFLLFSYSQKSKEINSYKNEIEVLKLESNTLLETNTEINSILNIVEDKTTFLNMLKNNYKNSLPTIEETIKDYESNEKVAFLTFIVDKTDNIDKTINILNENNIIATFFTNSITSAKKISDNGQLIGLYIDSYKKNEDLSEKYKEIIETFNLDLFILDSSLNDLDIKIDSLYQVKDNSSSEDKKLLNQQAYIDNIVETTADRDFLTIRINLSNTVGISSINDIITKLKGLNYIFLPLISDSSTIQK